MAERAAAKEAAPEEDLSKPLPDLVRELIADGRVWLNAEVAVYRAEARRRLAIATIGAGLMVAAVALLSGTLIALLLGIMIALMPIVGAVWAIIIVTLVSVLLALVLAYAGWMQFRRLSSKGKTNEVVP